MVVRGSVRRTTPTAGPWTIAADGRWAAYSRPVDAPTRNALVEVTRLLDHAGIPFQVGGSALLHALGLVDQVGDLDLVFRSRDREDLSTTLERATGAPPEFDVVQEPGFASAWRARHAYLGTDLDMTGGIALRYPGGFVARLPFTKGTTWDLDGVAVPLAPLSDWLLVYRYHNPQRGRVLEPLVPPEQWAALLAAIGAPAGFDGTYR
jgi:hypothetical protein